MRLIIAGSRNLKWAEVEAAMCHMPWEFDSISEVVSGCARGVDRLGEIWAAQNGIAIKLFPADWDKFGKSAGFIRNGQMAEYSDALMAIWDGNSRGTADMVRRMKGLGKAVHVELSTGQKAICSGEGISTGSGLHKP